MPKLQQDERPLPTSISNLTLKSGGDSKSLLLEWSWNQSREHAHMIHLHRFFQVYPCLCFTIHNTSSNRRYFARGSCTVPFLRVHIAMVQCRPGRTPKAKRRGLHRETRETTVRVAKISKLICRLRSILASWGCVTSLMSDPVRRTVSLPSRTEWRTWRHHNPPTYVRYTLNAWTTSIEFWTRFHLYKFILIPFNSNMLYVHNMFITHNIDHATKQRYRITGDIWVQFVQFLFIDRIPLSDPSDDKKNSEGTQTYLGALAK